MRLPFPFLLRGIIMHTLLRFPLVSSRIESFDVPCAVETLTRDSWKAGPSDPVDLQGPLLLNQLLQKLMP